MDEDAAGGSAALALAGEAHADNGARHRLVDVGVAHHDHRALAAELQGHRDQLLGRHLVDELAGLDGAGEGHLADVLVLDQRRAAAGAVAGEDVEHALRQHLVHDLAGAQHREGRFLGGFHHHGVASHQRRRDLERHQQQRHVPGNDRADDADRLAQRDGEGVGLERHALALELRSETAIEGEDVGEDAGLDPALGADRLAGLQGDELRQFLDVIAEDAAAFRHQPAALARQHLAPGLLRLGCRLHRRVDVARIAVGRVADLLLRRGIDDGEGAAGDRRHHAAIDQHLAGHLAGQFHGVEDGLQTVLKHAAYLPLIGSRARVSTARSPARIGVLYTSPAPPPAPSAYDREERRGSHGHVTVHGPGAGLQPELVIASAS